MTAQQPAPTSLSPVARGNIARRPLTRAEVEAFGTELDALRDRTLADIGEADARYIKRIYAAVRYTEALGRGLLFFGLFPPAWVLGTLLLGVSKILENMELGHNVMHGQYDWMNDPRFDGKTYEWDVVGTSDSWRKTHNFQHHTYTNVKGMDDDIGYGLLRLFPEQRWRPFYLFQPIIAVIFALMFQWGVAIQDLRLGRYFAGKMTREELAEQFRPVGRKMRRQLLKDYVFFPLLAGPFFLPVLLGNLVANGLRNLWTYMIIFCGHFTANVEVFPKEMVENETRGEWYLRQLRGSSNLRGGKLFHIMSGNLSHQIEHHLFPDIPARRYAELSRDVRAICDRYGIYYNTGSLASQFGQVVWRILRYAFPSKPVKLAGKTLVAD
ncbi:fatty acid desaturase family protein [Isoalcanivorax indicus]|uniref:fatty acid desaturase family protein n=1 Tax=Isoalcanivorax indicus TaxID=2202653 RepID=UPI000DB9B094|nr:acyl-CoA desaturase [Isoalcanivorax indicus]